MEQLDQSQEETKGAKAVAPGAHWAKATHFSLIVMEVLIKYIEAQFLLKHE